MDFAIGNIVAMYDRYLVVRQVDPDGAYCAPIEERRDWGTPSIKYPFNRLKLMRTAYCLASVKRRGKTGFAIKFEERYSPQPLDKFIGNTGRAFSVKTADPRLIECEIFKILCKRVFKDQRPEGNEILWVNHEPRYRSPQGSEPYILFENDIDAVRFGLAS